MSTYLQTVEDLPEIDPQKVSLQIPSEIVAAGFNVVNRGAPVFGEVIQRTAERLVNVGASLKPLFASSLGFGGARGNLKRETGDESEPALEQENEASSNLLVTAEPPSQFKRSYEPSENSEVAESQQKIKVNEEEKEKLRNILLARTVIERLIEKQLEKELEDQKEQIKKETTEDVGEKVGEVQNLVVIPDETPSSNPEESSIIEAPQDVKKTLSAEEAASPTDLQSEQSSNAEQSSAQTFQNSPIVVLSSPSESQMGLNVFPSTPTVSESRPAMSQIVPSRLQSNPVAFPSEQSILQNSPIVSKNDLPRFQSNPSPFQGSPVIRSTPTAFQSHQSAIPSSPTPIQNPSTFHGSQPVPSNPSNNPYFNQQYRDYNPHVKRQAPLHDFYHYQQPNVARFRPQYGNQYVLNRY